jgi:hypothetical protein
MIHTSNGFFMSWYGNQKGEGFEYHLLTFGFAFAVILAAGGKWSIDSFLGRQPRRTLKSAAKTSINAREIPARPSLVIRWAIKKLLSSLGHFGSGSRIR